MSRVTENSNTAALNYSLGKTKSKLEDLQLKGSNLKRINKPSDDPLGNVDLLNFRSAETDATQFRRNSSYASTLLGYTETALNDLTELITRAKELAIAQASDFYSGEARRNVANEIAQLKKQALAISNRRFGNRYIFSGFNTLQQPFDKNGIYKGDDGNIFIEISKDFFIPVNLNGKEVFVNNKAERLSEGDPLEKFPKNYRPENIKDTNLNDPESLQEDQETEDLKPDKNASRSLASTPSDSSSDFSLEDASQGTEGTQTIFEQLQILTNALLANDSTSIQELLPSLDETLERLISLRTRVGALTNSLHNAELGLENMEITHAAHRSKVEDADVAEIFSDLTKYQNVLKTTYKAGSTLINTSLLDFLR